MFISGYAKTENVLSYCLNIFFDVVIYNEHVPQDITFLLGMTFLTQSKNRNKIKRDIGRHILNDFNFNIKGRENLKATHPTIF